MRNNMSLEYPMGSLPFNIIKNKDIRKNVVLKNINQWSQHVLWGTRNRIVSSNGDRAWKTTVYL